MSATYNVLKKNVSFFKGVAWDRQSHTHVYMGNINCHCKLLREKILNQERNKERVVWEKLGEGKYRYDQNTILRACTNSLIIINCYFLKLSSVMVSLVLVNSNEVS